MSTLALIPARAGSKGIPGKNFRPLGYNYGPMTCSLVRYAADCAQKAGIEQIAISTDHEPLWGDAQYLAPKVQWMQRPTDLAQDDTPMLSVVQHALQQIPGPPDQIIVLLQPTQPFRTPQHVQQAIALLQESQADSVVSVVELPKTHHPRWVCEIAENGELTPWPDKGDVGGYWWDRPACRQDLSPIFKPDGTVYAFTREAFERCESIYGSTVRPLIIPAAESCELDSESDWASVERRWQELDRVRC